MAARIKGVIFDHHMCKVTNHVFKYQRLVKYSIVSKSKTIMKIGICIISMMKSDTIVKTIV